MARVLGTVVLSCLFFLLGCSNPPQLPTIPNADNTPKTDIVLRDTLTVQDFQNLFHTINQKGQFNHLGQLFTQASEQDLTQLGKWTNFYLFQEAINPDGFVSILENRVHDQSFSKLFAELKTNCLTDSCPKILNLLKNGLSHPNFPKLLKRNSYLFSAEWLAAVSKLNFRATASNGDNNNTSQIVNDISKLFSATDFKPKFIYLIGQLKKSSLGQSFFLTLNELRENYGEQVFNDLSEQLKLSVHDDPQKPSIINRWLALAKLLNQPSHGLFTHAQETLKTDDGQTLVRLLSERFEPLILKGTAGFIRETLTHPLDDESLDLNFWKTLPRKSIANGPTENFGILLQRIQYAFDKMSSTSKTIKEPKAILNAYLLALWFEQFAKENIDSITLIETENFNESLWATAIKPISFSVNLISVDPTGKPIKDKEGKLVLSAQVEKDLLTLGLNEFVDDLKYLIKQNSFGPTLVKISLNDPSLTLKSSLTAVISNLHRDRPFADPIPFLTSVVFMFTRQDSKAPINLASLETDNMLLSIENIIRGVSFVNLRRLNTFLFEDLQLGSISQEDRERLKSLYPNNPECAELLDSILSNLQIIYDLDKHEPNKISLLEAYHVLLNNSRNKDLPGLSAIFNFVESTHLFQFENNQALFPNLLKAVQDSNANANFLTGLSFANEQQQTVLLNSVHSVFGDTSQETEELLSFMHDVLLPQASTIASLHSFFQEHPLNFSLSHQELNWIKRFIDHESFIPTYEAVQQTLTGSQLNKVTDELEQLHNLGELQNALKVLGNIESERMQRLALVLWDWDRSNELKSFIWILKLLTKS